MNHQENMLWQALNVSPSLFVTVGSPGHRESIVLQKAMPELKHPAQQLSVCLMHEKKLHDVIAHHWLGGGTPQPLHPLVCMQNVKGTHSERR